MFKTNTVRYLTKAGHTQMNDLVGLQRNQHLTSLSSWYLDFFAFDMGILLNLISKLLHRHVTEHFQAKGNNAIDQKYNMFMYESSADSTGDMNQPHKWWDINFLTDAR